MPLKDKKKAAEGKSLQKKKIQSTFFFFHIQLQVDIDELTEIADDFDVSSVPVLVVIRDGKVEKRMVGLQDTDKIRTWVQSAVK